MNPQVKEISKEDPRIVCQYCQRSEINSLEWGPMYQLAGVTVHYFCMLFSAGLSQNGEDDEGILGFLPIDIRKELKRGEKLKCKFCKQPRATIGCSVKNCKVSYHYPCGLLKDCIFHFIGNFESYCCQHKEVVDIPLPQSEWECPICFCPVDDDIPLWPPCCKKKVFHKRCIMEMAKNHGAHFFKCPLCNDRDTFSVAMRRSGVYLPDRDASWETVPNAFEEHMRLYNRCDADKCLCPRGNEYSSKSESKPWKVVRCGACGAAGIHKRCGNLKNLTWRCSTCSDILSDKRRNESMNSSRIQRQQYDLSSDEETEEAPPIGLRETIVLKPQVEESITSTSSDSSSDEETKTRTNYKTIYDDRFGRHLVMEDSDSEDSGDSSNSEDVNEEIFIQPSTRLRQKLELISTAKNGIFNSIKSYVDPCNILYDDEKWKLSRASTFDAKLKDTLVQCCRQSSSRNASGSSEAQKATDNISNPVRTVPTGSASPVSLPLVGRDKLIKVDSKKKLLRQIVPGLNSKPEVISESSTEGVKISLKSPTNDPHDINSKSCVRNNEDVTLKNDYVSGSSKDNAEESESDIKLIDNPVSNKHEETCITLDDDDDDVEIVQEKIQSKTSAFMDMVNKAKARCNKPSTVVRLGLDDDQIDDIELADTFNPLKPTINFSSFRKPPLGIPISHAFLSMMNKSSGYSSRVSGGRLSSVVRNNLKSGSDRKVETMTVELLSDDDEEIGQSSQAAKKVDSHTTNPSSSNTKSKCSTKRERLSPNPQATLGHGIKKPRK